MANQYRQYIYSKEWRKKSKKAIAWTKGRCTLFPWLKASHTHHMTYKNLKHEKVWRDIVPLSKFAHKLVHAHNPMGLFKQQRGSHFFTPCWNLLLRILFPFVVLIGFVIRNKH